MLQDYPNPNATWPDANTRADIEKKITEFYNQIKESMHLAEDHKFGVTYELYNTAWQEVY